MHFTYDTLTVVRDLIGGPAVADRPLLAKSAALAKASLVALVLMVGATEVTIAKAAKPKPKRMEAAPGAAGMPGKAGMDLPPLDDDLLRMANDPVAKPLSIVDAFSVDGPVTADKVAALKLAAEKKSQAKQPATPKPES
jgi:hypothetical protein